MVQSQACDIASVRLFTFRQDRMMHTKTSHNYQKFVGSMLIQILRSSGLQCCFGQTWFLALLNKPRFLSIGQLKRSPSKSPPVGTSEADALSIRPLGLV